MEAGTLVEWLVAPGDRVSRGDIVAVVETQKGAIEIEVFEDGVFADLCVPVGEEVPVGTVLAILQADGATAPAPAPAPPVAMIEVVEPRSVAPKPEARPTVQPSARPKVSPAARRRAAELGIDPSTLAGTGPEGAVSLRDIEQVSAQPTRPRTKTAARGIDPVEMRKAIAAAMAKAKREIPHYYLDKQIDLTTMLDWLQKTNADRPVKERLLTIVPMLKATALALRDHPDLNGWYDDGGFQPSGSVHVGAAIALRGGGLIAPALHDVDTLSLDALMTRLRELVARVRAGRLRSSEMTDATVTVTSMLEDGIDAVYPVIYPPQVAVVGFGAIQARPWAVGDALAVRRVSQVTLAADHRVSDGRRGARFLQRLDRLLQEPAAL